MKKKKVIRIMHGEMCYKYFNNEMEDIQNH